MDPLLKPAPTIDEHAGVNKPATPSEAKRSMLGGAFSALYMFFGFMFSLPLLLLGRRRHDIEEVTVYAAHPSFYLWALILVGAVSSVIVANAPNWAGTLGWLYVWVLLYFIATLLYDFNLRLLGLWLLIFALLWLGAKYIEHIKNIALVGAVFNYFVGLKPKLDPGFVQVLSWLLLLPWIGSLVNMALNGRKRFTPNEIGEFHFGEGSELTDRVGLRFRTKYRDVLETLLTFGGGDLIAVDNHQNVIKRWDNIIGLYFFWGDLDRILHQRAAIVDIENDEDRKE